MLRISVIAVCSSVVGAIGVLFLQTGEQSRIRNADLAPEFVALHMDDGRTLHVARHETTLRQWQNCVVDGACRQAGKASIKTPSHPVTKVNMFDVQSYITWLNAKTGLSVRLPSYEEWLTLASDHKPAPKKKLFDDPRLAWAADYDLTAEPIQKRTVVAGSFGANNVGLSDIKGNVWEWTSTVCGTPATASLRSCRSGRIVMGEHVAVLSDLVRDPGNASCGAGLPPANLGFRLVHQGVSSVN